MSNKEMTPELLKELKAYVFALYISTDTLVLPCFMSRDKAKICQTTILTTDLLHAHKDGHAYLQVMHLSSITDEHAIEVAKICLVTDFVQPDQQDESIKRISRDEDRVWIYYWVKTSYEYDDWETYPFVIDFEDGEMSDHMGCCGNSLAAYQYLQQQGYALPIYFKGVHYSVEQLIELGIFKIDCL